MKVILTGATGSIGAKTLQQCFSSPKITSLIVLSRRALIDGDKKEIAHPKLKVVIHEDFSSYPTSLLEREEFKGAKACIWTVGGLPQKYPDIETARIVNAEYPVAAAKAMLTILGPQMQKGEKFRFIYVSGTKAERDLEKNLWIMQEGRRHKGEAENRLFEIADQNSNVFEAYSARSGKVFPSETNVAMSAVLYAVDFALLPSIRFNELAAALISIALDGAGQQVVTNQEMVVIGRKALAAES